MRSGALDYQQQLEVFFGQATIYPGDEITVVLENGTRRGPCSWEATYVGPPSTGPLQTPGDFYNFFVLGLYPASFDESQPVVPSPSPTSVTSSPSETTAAESDSGSNGAYPTPETLLPLNDDDIDLPQTFFLNESSIAVLSITQFSAYPAQPNKFVQIIQAFIKRSKDAGMKKVVIDVQQNMGGSPYLAIEVFKQVRSEASLVLLYSNINALVLSLQRALHRKSQTCAPGGRSSWQCNHSVLAGTKGKQLQL